MCCCDCNNNMDKYAALQQVIEELKNEPGALMPIMQRAQDIYGYLPEEVMNHIAKELDIPVSDVYGVATFYAQFNLEPKGKYIISVCLGTACYVKGAQQVIDKFSEELKIKPGETTDDGMFTLDALRCIGACGIAPAVSINGKVYPKMTVSQVREIIAQQYLIVEKEKEAMGGVTA